MSKTIIRAKGGTGEHVVPLRDIRVEDLWHIVQVLKDPAKLKSLSSIRNKDLAFQCGESILGVWHLCHDLLRHIQDEEGERRRPGESIPDFITRLSALSALNG